ncbi:MAG: PKD domain-containing protein [Candidatus Pacearchaeota archaeon]
MRYKRLNFFIIIILISIIISLNNINYVSSSFIIGNKSGYLEDVYAPSSVIRGWINISLNNEPANSKLSFFENQEINLIDFLKKQNFADFKCMPSDCSDNYESNNPETLKNFIIDFQKNKIIGIRFFGKLNYNPVSQISFKITSNAPSTCYQALKIDLGDDLELDWIPTKGENDFSCSRGESCFNYSEVLSDRRIDNKGFCEKIKVPALSSFRVGADIKKGTTPNPGLKMIVYDINMEKYPLGECNLNVLSSGESSCNVNLGLVNETYIIVCIKADTLTDYTIASESANKNCGFYDINNFNDFNVDYPIFAEGGKFAPIGSFVFDENSFKNYENPKSIGLKNYINDYLEKKFNNNCENGCIVPIKFISNIEQQQIIISDLNLVFSTDTGPAIENKFYDLTKTYSKINSDFLKLDLDKANFTVPNVSGNKTLVIRLQEKEIIRKEIMIKDVPTISFVTPTEVFAGIPANFSVVVLNAEANMSYKWNFGDNSSEELTNKNFITHTYSKIGAYDLKIKIFTKNGEFEKTFTINSISPKSIINNTISNYRKKIKNFEDEINSLDDFSKSTILSLSNITNIKEELENIDKRYQQGFIDDENSIEIARQLINLKIPHKIHKLQKINPSDFFVDIKQVDLTTLENIGAGKLNIEESKEDYVKAINKWLLKNLEIKFESVTYSLSYVNREDEILGSFIKVNLTPKNKIKNLFFIINSDLDKVKFKENYDISPNSLNEIIINFRDFEDVKNIYFFIPTKINLNEIPLYVSPYLNELEIEKIEIKCNTNKICEKDLGENSNNCSDCPKSNLKNIIILIIILLIIAFVVYIILQEWYKRYYERSLFKDRNQLFNLINFIYTAEINGLQKYQIFKKLRENKWSNEQIRYAWNKLHGMRTGMWEIPIFKKSENKEVRKQLQMRQNPPNNRTFY